MHAVALNSEFAELMQICMMEAQAESEKGSKACRAYFRESAAILEAILDQSPPAR